MPSRVRSVTTFQRILLVVILALGFTVAGVGSATAHSELLSSTPADGAVLTTPPASVELVFNEPVSPAGLQVVARGPQGVIELGAPTVVSASVTAGWPQSSAAGDYTVSYRVVSADGHPIDGTIAMSITGDAASGTQSATGQSATPTAPPPVELEPVVTQTEANSAFPWWVAVIAVIGGVGIGAAIARYMRSRSES